MNIDDFGMKIQVIDSEEIEKFFWTQLVSLGYAPDDCEIQDLADICFDFLCSIGVVEEIEELDEE